jgi:hypothetical protein
MYRNLVLLLSIGMMIACVALAYPANAQTVWSGFTKSFTRPSFSDGGQPENQDTLTSNVTFARHSSQGLFNAAVEDSYTRHTSPQGTRWASNYIEDNDGLEIAATNWEALTFKTWLEAYTFPFSRELPQSITSRNAVVHLIEDDIYLDIQFTYWGGSDDAGFTYMRAEPPSSGPSGDYNGDGTVDAADYTVWRDTFGQTVTSPGSGADGDESGEIDAGDYLYWKDRFGQVVSGAGAASTAIVPEPATIALISGGLLLLASRRQRITPRGPGQDD